MGRYRALVEYDGTNYHGFQRQLYDKTIQAEIERAIEAIARQPIRIIGAGRTDAGVHAIGQVIAFDLEWRHGHEKLCKAINANLPGDIVLKDVIPEKDLFHPRFDATSREYKYDIYNANTRSPIRRRTSWFVQQPLDMVRMNQSAQLIIGVHDFATFGSAPVGDFTVRHVYVARWRYESDILRFTIRANAYLYRMVRSLVGSMKMVGTGEWSVDEFEDAFTARDRDRAAQTAPPGGLTLMKVEYGNSAEGEF